MNEWTVKEYVLCSESSRDFESHMRQIMAELFVVTCCAFLSSAGVVDYIYYSYMRIYMCYIGVLLCVVVVLVKGI
jgi:hypothetical protein